MRAHLHLNVSFVRPAPRRPVGCEAAARPAATRGEWVGGGRIPSCSSMQRRMAGLTLHLSVISRTGASPIALMEIS